MPRTRLQQWKKRLREIVELWLVPIGSALLPWPISRRLLWRLSRFRGWYFEEAIVSVRHAEALGVTNDTEAFWRRLRFRLLVEHMDCFQVPLRSRRYIRRWVRVHGDTLPATGGLQLIGSHHGCGYWFVPWADSIGRSPTIVIPKLGPHLARASLLGWLYLRLRYYLLARASGRPMIVRDGTARNQVADLLAQGEVGWGACDMPTNRPDAVDVRLAGWSTRLAQNMFEIAQAQGVPIFLFSSDTDLATGYRHVHIQRAVDGTPEDQVRQFADLLSASILRDPTGWRFFSIAHSFFPHQLRAPDVAP